MENEILEVIDEKAKDNFEVIIDMLHEFDYKRNGKLTTIHFLAYCIEKISEEIEEEFLND